MQQVRGLSRDAIRPELLNTMGSDRTDVPEYQMGDGCLVDQLVGQYQAEVAGLGPLVDPKQCRAALESIHRYNYKRELYEHDTVQRTFALNDEAAIVIADYARGKRPDVPFPYYAEVMTGFEYTAASHMLYAGMVREGIECIANIRARYDGARRNPWDEAECGSHYARAMAAWSAVLALSGFRYRGATGELTVEPRLPVDGFRCFWSTGTGWGTFAFGHGGAPFTLSVLSGSLPCGSVALTWSGAAPPVGVEAAGQAVPHTATGRDGTLSVTFAQPVRIDEGQALVVR